MTKIKLLFLAAHQAETELMKALLDYERFEVEWAESLDAIEDKDSFWDILLISLLTDMARRLDFVARFRRSCQDKPCQILFITHDALAPGDIKMRMGDDFMKAAVLEAEVMIRLDAAAIRLNKQLALYQEREFFKKAVKQEEELSSRILEHHIHLKKAFKDIESLNGELEQSNRKLEKIAKFDMLSGLLNRMSLFSVIDVEIERAIRTDQHLSGIMLDVDHFKQINDNYGHQFGDEVIRMIGLVLKRNLRKYDSAGRYGGEEFFILLPNSTRDQAARIAERFRSELEKTPVILEGREIHITASLGIAQFHPDESKEMWLRRADKAMYKAKSSGRNMVMLES